jgi:hypothetical protein
MSKRVGEFVKRMATITRNSKVREKWRELCVRVVIHTVAGPQSEREEGGRELVKRLIEFRHFDIL